MLVATDVQIPTAPGIEPCLGVPFCGYYKLTSRWATGSSFRHHFNTALRTNAQHMARALAQNAINACDEGVKQIQRHESLNGSGKTAAVNPVSSPPVQEMLAQR